MTYKHILDKIKKIKIKIKKAYVNIKKRLFGKLCECGKVK
jgi:hypothetical protein